MAIPPGMLILAGPLVPTSTNTIEGLTEAYPPTEDLARLHPIVFSNTGEIITVRSPSEDVYVWEVVPPQDAYAYQKKVSIDPTIPGTLTIADTGDPLEIQLFSQGFKGNLLKGVPFVTQYEGTVQFHCDMSTGAAYDFKMAFKHQFNNGSVYGAFTSRRRVRARVTPNNWYTLPLSAFNSVSVIGDTYIADDDTEDPVSTELLSDYMFGTLTLEIEALQNDGSTRVARTLQAVEFDQCGVFFEQREPYPGRRGLT